MAIYKSGNVAVFSGINALVEKTALPYGLGTPVHLCYVLFLPVVDETRPEHACCVCIHRPQGGVLLVDAARALPCVEQHPVHAAGGSENHLPLTCVAYDRACGLLYLLNLISNTPTHTHTVLSSVVNFILILVTYSRKKRPNGGGLRIPIPPFN